MAPGTWVPQLPPVLQHEASGMSRSSIPCTPSIPEPIPHGAQETMGGHRVGTRVPRPMPGRASGVPGGTGAEGLVDDGAHVAPTAHPRGEGEPALPEGIAQGQAEPGWAEGAACGGVPGRARGTQLSVPPPPPGLPREGGPGQRGGRASGSGVAGRAGWRGAGGGPAPRGGPAAGADWLPVRPPRAP